ncbi:MAG: four helix bundle protein [Desulfovibrionaceae bacterium]
MRDHTRLRAFEMADDIALRVYQITRFFPKEETYGLTAQIRRAAVSIPSNIVEACSRKSLVEYVRFLEIAFGSLRELRYQFSLSIRLGFCGQHDSTPLEQALLELEKVLHALIFSVRKQVQASKSFSQRG